MSVLIKCEEFPKYIVGKTNALKVSFGVSSNEAESLMAGISHISCSRLCPVAL